MKRTRPTRIGAAAIAAALTALPAGAATYGELSGAPAPGTAGVATYSAGPYASAPNAVCPPYCLVAPSPAYGGPEGTLPGGPDYRVTPYLPPYQANPRAYLPLAPQGSEPDVRLLLWSFGQTNSVTDPYNTLGLSTPFMFVPWSTPLSGWTNAQTWNWWRERSGALPRNW